MAKNTGVLIEKKLMTRKRIIVIGGMTLAVIVFVIFSPYGIATRLRLMSEESELHSTTAQMRGMEDSLRSTIRWLQTDSTQIERLARERYGFIKPGEEVYIIKRDSSSP